MRVADYIMTRLQEAGIGHVFLVTGRGCLFLSDALAKNTALKSVCVHHEQSAAYAAVAYASQTGGLGACLVSTGCGSTNAMTGVLSAWQDGIPCIFISGQNVLRETSRHTGIPLRTYGQQEADIVALVQPITKYARMIQRAEEIVEAMDEALRLATSGRQGPVWLDIPLDLQSALIEPPDRPVLAPSVRTAPEPAAVAEVLAELAAAERPVVLLGSGVRSAGAEENLRVFVEARSLPVAFAASAPDIYGSANRLSIGSVGAMGCSRAGAFAVQNADYVLVLGSRLSSLTTGTDFCKFARAAKITVVDIDPVEHSKDGIRIDRLLIADLGLFLAEANRHPSHPTSAAWVEKCGHWKRLFSAIEPPFDCAERVDLYLLADRLSRDMPAGTSLVTDSGLIEVILPTNVRFADGMRAIHPVSQGAMGFALPASIGVSQAGAASVVAVIGDGSIMMNLQELETIRFQDLPIKILVINNNAYSIIRRRQRELFRKRTIGTDPENGVSCPDFAKVAACFDFPYVRFDGKDELISGLAAVLSRPGRVLVEIMGRVDQGYIELGQARSDVDRRLVRRPLEDQDPFLDRTLFLSEMIIPPIDQ